MVFSANTNTQGDVYSSDNNSILSMKFMNAMRRKFPNIGSQVPLIHDRTLYIRLRLENGIATYSDIDLGTGTTALLKGECRLKDGEYFMPTHTAVMIRKFTKTDAGGVGDGIKFPSTFPDPNVFVGAGEIDSLCTIYGIGAALTLDGQGTTFVDKYDGMNFLSVPSRSYTPAAASGAPADVSQELFNSCCNVPYRSINPSCCVITGGEDNTATYKLASGNYSALAGNPEVPAVCNELIIAIKGKLYNGTLKGGCPVL